MEIRRKGENSFKCWWTSLLLTLVLFAFSQKIEIPAEWRFYRVYHDMRLDTGEVEYVDRVFEKLGGALFAAFAPGEEVGYVVILSGMRIGNVLDVVSGYKPELRFKGAEEIEPSDEDVVRLYFWRAGRFDEGSWSVEKVKAIKYGPDKGKWDKLYQVVVAILSKR